MTRTEELLVLCDAEDTADIDLPCGWLKQLVELVRLQNEALKACEYFTLHMSDIDVRLEAIAAFNKFEGGE